MWSSARRLLGHASVRYVVVGGLSFVVDFGLLALFHDVLRVPAGLAAGLAFAITFVVNYSLQRAFAFGSRGSHGRALFRYVVLVIANLLFTALVVQGAVWCGIPWVVGKAISTVIVTTANFFIYKHWVFAAPSEEREVSRV